MRRKTRGRGAYGLVAVRYIHNRSQKTGRHVTGDLKRLLYYNVYGSKQNNPEQIPRGKMYDQTGKQIGYKAYKEWALARSETVAYTYRAIVSPKGHLLNDEDFATAVAAAALTTEIAAEFRMVVHRDTPHAHAHLVFQSERTIRKAELEEWKATLRRELISLEELRAKEKGVSLPEVDKGDDDTAPTETKKRTRRRRRGKRKDLGLEM